MTNIMTFLKDESGASAAEYALLISLIAAIIAGAVAILGTKIQAKFTAVTTALG